MTDTPPDPASRHPKHGATRRLFALVAAGAAAVVLASAVVYGTFGLRGKSDTSACPASAELTQAMQPLARGEVAAVQVARAPRKLPELAFSGPDGKPMTLADFRGRTVLLNLWATWCVPCRTEMPALDALQAKLGGKDFEVVAVNIDTRNLDKPKAWLAETGITRLAYYADPAAKTFQELKAVGKAFGMPTTLIVDPQGCELATLAGPAEWHSDDALRLVTAALGRKG
ncbi:TlpA family protein disulfide reductase [Alsobacter sp. SYSU M60028]|uniref:TlpA family protein disulfide reductase n=1 Tax=Alsobacter ponti TaxID=2962936 RepID=A0ABT1LGQ5_9HYPH|nr:TlpA disulfide reductase family protein [Alsobacter ponti]MCP8940682.1 TlpA family protein disulfide reductase [Alsobacter ponti]